MPEKPQPENHRHAACGAIHGEHPWGDRGQLICLVIFLSAWILDSFLFKLSTGPSRSVPLYARVLAAVAMLIFALYLMSSGHRAISHEVQSNPRVLKDGAFAHVRHPLYLAALLFYLFLFVLTLSLISLGLCAGIFLFYNAIASYEERWLENRFGQEYKDYSKRVPRWIPRLGPARF